MSFSELNYRHKVWSIVISDDYQFNNDQSKDQIDDQQNENDHLNIDHTDSHQIEITPVEIPVSVGLMRIPAKPLPLPEVLKLLEDLPDAELIAPPPYLEVQVSISGPEPSLKTSIETAVRGKQVRLARITPVYPEKTTDEKDSIATPELQDIHPLDIFSRRYRELYDTDIPQELVVLFNEIAGEAERENITQ